jgi:stage V sporulation protein AC
MVIKVKKNYTNKEYKKYVEKKSPKSNIVKDTVSAFIIGGLICIFTQGISNFLKARSVDEETIKSALPVIMVGLGAFFTGIGWYEKLAKYGGAGTIVPITGFANSIVSPAMEFKAEGHVMGVGAKMFVIAGPVLVYGITVSVIAGIIFFFLGAK